MVTNRGRIFIFVHHELKEKDVIKCILLSKVDGGTTFPVLKLEKILTYYKVSFIHSVKGIG